MSTNEQKPTRRDVLAGMLGAAAVAAFGPEAAASARADGGAGAASSLALCDQAAAAGRARIVRVVSDRIWRGDARDPEIVAQMVARGIVELTGDKTPDEAWRRYFKPGMRVGLKVNLLGRPLIYTAPEMTDALAAAAIAAGVKPQDVVVWDRHRDHFGATVYKFGTGRHGQRIEAGGRYDAQKTLASSVGPAPIDAMATEATDVTINLPIMKDHGMAGVTFALKNIGFGCYDHPRPAHGNGCDPFVAEAYAHYLTQTRLPLAVLDATEACYDGGPQPGSRAAIWRENAIYLATDPVALDVVCRQVINDKRREHGLPDKTRQARHIETAAAKGLGVGDVARIDVATVRV